MREESESLELRLLGFGGYHIYPPLFPSRVLYELELKTDVLCHFFCKF